MLQVMYCVMRRREFLRWGLTSAVASAIPVRSQTVLNQLLPSASGEAAIWNVRAMGAKGDGLALDTAAINKSIAAAADAGGGTVFFPAGVYRSYSIHLKSHVGLYLDHGAVILAAENPATAND